MKYNSFAQGTIEYLVIIAIIVVLSLIVVSLLATIFYSPSQEIIDSSSTLGNVSSGGISIVEAVSDLDGDSLVKLGNNYGEFITMTKITLCNGVENSYSASDGQLVGGDSKLFHLSSVACVSGEKSKNCEIKLEYTTREGLVKTEYRNIIVDCVLLSSGSNPGGRAPIEPTSSCGPGFVAYLEGYTNIDSCSDITGTGNYLFTENMTCNIIVNANDININGNYCTLTGNISGSNSDYGVSGYSFNLINLTADAVSSTGGNSLPGTNAGNGGAITLTNSSVDLIISNGGNPDESNPEQFGYSGNGGNITLVDSNVSGAITSHGPAGYQVIANRGSVSLVGSIVGSINASGNGDDVLGVVTINDSNVGAINASGLGDNLPSCSGGGTVNSSNGSIIGSIVSNGGPSYNGGCMGGTISLTNSTVSSIFSIGGVGPSGGNGGTVTLSNVLGLTYINVSGTDGEFNGGDGGDITFDPATCPLGLTSENIIVDAGNPAGSFGTITGFTC